MPDPMTFTPQRVTELEGIDVSEIKGSLVTNISRGEGDKKEYLVIGTRVGILTSQEAYHDVSYEAAQLFWLELYRGTGKTGRMFRAGKITSPELQNQIKQVVYKCGRLEVDVFGTGYVVLVSSYSIGD